MTVRDRACTETHDALFQSLERVLVERYGPMVGNDDLRVALGYPSMEAFRQALSRRTAPVPVFGIEHRRGKFALATDIARWLARQRNHQVDASEPQSGCQCSESQGERPM